MYLSFYRDIKFETVLNLGQVWPLIVYVYLTLNKLHDFSLSD